MATLPLVFLAAPEKDYLSKAEMVAWLGLKDGRALSRLIRAGLVTHPRPRPGERRPVWTKLAASVAKWNVDHADHYESRPDPEGEKSAASGPE